MKKRNKEMMRFIMPSVGGLFVAYLYNVVDGIFVGNGVGSEALGAVNIAVPFITFVVAICAMFPMGGATIVAIQLGKEDQKKANEAFTNACILTLSAAILFMIIGMVFTDQIVDFCGGEQLSEKMRTMASEYLFYYSAFSIPMLLSNCLSVFVRNDGAPATSFIGMCIGAVSNIFFDWLFVYPLHTGVIGAAIASGLGQIFSFLVLMSHFFSHKGELKFENFSLKAETCIRICKRGVAEAVTQLTTPVTSFCYNIMLANMMGDIGVSTFSVLSFITSLVNAMLSGVAQGLQPLWGNAYGRGEKEEVKILFRDGFVINTILSVLMILLLQIFDEEVIMIFNTDSELVNTASQALPVFSYSYLPMALNLIITAYLYSTRGIKQANLIALLRGIILKAIAIIFLPLLFSVKAIWGAPLCAEMITLLIALAIMKNVQES